VALLAVPGAAAAADGGPVASVAGQQCAQERSSVGKRAFRKRYGAKHAMRSCIRRNRGKAAQALGSATQDCRQQLAQEGPDEFIFDWAWDADTLDDAMSECIADGIDTILNPGDDSDDETDVEE
jgi:hypothetical protein